MKAFDNGSAVSLYGDDISFDQYRGKVILIVNTASECRYTPQYEGLEELYVAYKDAGLEILGFPCNQFGVQEPGESGQIAKFCEENYGVSFQMFDKVDVRGKRAHPLFKWLVAEAGNEPFDLDLPEAKSLTDFLAKTYPKLLEGDDVKCNFFFCSSV